VQGQARSADVALRIPLGNALRLIVCGVAAVASVAVGWLQTGHAGAQAPDVAVDSPGYRAAVAALGQAQGLLADGAGQMSVLVATIDELTLARDQVQASLPALTEATEATHNRLRRGQADLRRLAAAQYVNHGAGSLGDALLRTGDVLGTERGRVLLNVAGTAQLGDVARYEGRYDAAQFQLVTARQSLADLEARLATTTTERSTLGQRIAEAESMLPDLEQQVRVEYRLAEVAGTDLPYIAFEAYWGAARQQAAATPGCNLHWTVLGGIGRVESDHGRFRGTSLDLRGTTTGPIIGIALTGENETANIADTDAGALDGDTRWDRAVGPMQFIPTTWRSSATDGDGDGTASPHNIYDAARTAASYLCRSGDLGSIAGLRQAILTYNYSNAYVDAVLGHAGRYQHLGY